MKNRRQETKDQQNRSHPILRAFTSFSSRTRKDIRFMHTKLGRLLTPYSTMHESKFVLNPPFITKRKEKGSKRNRYFGGGCRETRDSQTYFFVTAYDHGVTSTCNNRLRAHGMQINQATQHLWTIVAARRIEFRKNVNLNWDVLGEKLR